MSSQIYRAMILAGCMLAGMPHSAAALDVQLFPLTGEIRLKNPGVTPIPFVIYSIRSPSGALNSSASVWKSISDNYDFSGNRFIDATNNWFKLSASTTELSEGVVGNPGGVLPAQRSVSLGRVWNVHKVPFPDLTFDFRNANGQSLGIVAALAIDGDYAGSGTVDTTDYNLWRQTFRSTSVLLADGNINGAVDAADYVLWRENRGRTRPSPPFGAAGGAAALHSGTAPMVIPEPTTLASWLAGTVLTLSGVRWRRGCRFRAEWRT